MKRSLLIKKYKTRCFKLNYGLKPKWFTKFTKLSHKVTIFSLYSSFLLISACSVGPDYARPALNLPVSYKEQQKSSGWKAASPADDQNKGLWYTYFNDDILNNLMQEAIEHNQDIAVAYANYQKAQATVALSQSSFFPTLNLSASQTRGQTTSLSGPTNSTNLRLNASWEPDLWGRVSRDVSSAKAQEQYSKAMLVNAQLSVQTSLAQNYFSLRILDKEIKFTIQSINASKKSLTITKNQYDAGLVTLLDVKQAETTLAKSQREKLSYMLSRSQFENAIAVLVGKTPAEFSIAPTDSLPLLPNIPVGIPSDLLERRPDVSAAERNMIAANELIGVAKSAYFPNFSFSASGGYGNTLATELVNPNNLVWSLGASLVQDIFDGKARSSRVEQAKADYNASLAEYRQTVLTAIAEVEDNLLAINLLEQQTKYQKSELNSSREAERLANNQYLAGTVDYTTVVTNQLQRYNSEISDLDLLGQRYSAAVLLVKALGGGWKGLDD